MSALAQLIAAGVEVKALPDGRLRATGKLTDATRALIRAHKPQILAELAANDSGADPDTEKRRTRALALLDTEPDRQIVVVAEAGDPAHVTVAIRGVALGELTIPADRYDGFALLALIQQYGHA